MEPAGLAGWSTVSQPVPGWPSWAADWGERGGRGACDIEFQGSDYPLPDPPPEPGEYI